MNKIVIAGLGPGSLDYILPITIKKIIESEIIIGGRRNLEVIDSFIKDKKTFEITKDFESLIKYIKNNRDKKIMMVVSGDSGFYSMLRYMNKNFEKNQLEVIPGLSSMQYFFGKIGEVWQDAKLASLHHKNFDYIKVLEKYRIVALLTDKKNTPQSIGKKLYEAGYDYEIIVGENLSYEDEKISYFKPSTLKDIDKNFQMNIVIIDRGAD